MKPYFQAGYDYKEFTKTFFGQEYYKLTAEAKLSEDKEEQENQNWCEKTMIIRNPGDSKFYIIWELIFMVAILFEVILVPFTACTSIEDTLFSTLNYEYAIDAIWLTNIFICFCTPFTRDVEKKNKCGEIAEKYIKSAFLFDVLSTLPCVVTMYNTDYIKYTYLTKILRVYHLLHFLRILLENIIDPLLNSNQKLSKQAKGKINYSLNMLLALCFVMHVIACMWLKVGEYTIDQVENANYQGSWIDQHLSEEQQKSLKTKYITSIYWVVTTLTTVGYGDVYGHTSFEYIYTMFVEFLGIAVFSMIMSSVNHIIGPAQGGDDIISEKLEKVDIWLVKLDNSRLSKSLPKILYDKIKLYIHESLLYDHKKLVDGYEFLEHLKPNLRFLLIKDLFSPMILDFQHIFEFEDRETGNEFLTFFVSALYCRVFIANQTIVKRLEHFSEFYLIHKGSVTISLSHKDQNEFFTLHPSNYFGDYQILMDLRASECYKSSVDSATYTHCLKKKDLQDLMVTFPDAKATFVERAKQRRIEFRRIKKQFEKFANVDKQADLDNNE